MHYKALLSFLTISTLSASTASASPAPSPTPTTFTKSVVAKRAPKDTYLYSASSRSISPMELCGMKGCIMTGYMANGAPLFAGPGCDHCADGWQPPYTPYTPPPILRTPSLAWTDPAKPTVMAVEYTTSTVIVTQTSIVTTTVTATQTKTSSVTEKAVVVATSWAIKTTGTTVTSTLVPSMAAYPGCMRVGTLDQGGALWSGMGCKGDSTYDGTNGKGCARVGTLDENGAMFIGEGCGKM